MLRLLFLSWVLAVGSMPPAAAASSQPARAPAQTRRVFILDSFAPGYRWTDNMLRGIDTAFRASGLAIESSVRFMDMKRIAASAAYFERLKESFRTGYANVHFDALMACDNDAFTFMRRYRDELFPGVPLVFVSINGFTEAMLEGRTDLTGTSENTDYLGTVEIGLKLCPRARTVIVVTDDTTTGRAHRAAVAELEPRLAGRADLRILSLGDTTLAALGRDLAGLKDDSVVLLLHHFSDRTGASFPVQESARELARQAAVPCLITSDTRLGLGPLGGNVVSGYHQGEAAAGMVLAILEGADVRSIPVMLKSPNQPMFDDQAMRRFGIAPSELPPDSIIVNQPLSILGHYGRALMIAMLVFALLLAAVVVLGLEIRRRRRVEASLRASEVRFRTLVESIPQKIFLKGRDSRWLAVNEAFARDLGIPAAEVVGKADRDFFPQELADKYRADDLRVMQTGQAEEIEERYVQDGRDVWVHTIKAPVQDEDGKTTGVFGIFWDVTARKEAEAALRQTQAILQAALDQSTAGIAIADAPDGRLRYVNDAGLLIRGGDRQTVVNGVGIDQYVASWCLLDLDGRPLQTEEVPLTRAVRFGETCSREFIIRRAVGDDRVVLANAAPIRDDAGQVVAGIVVFVDITESQRAQAELRRDEARFRSLASVLQYRGETTRDFLDLALDEAIRLTGSEIGYVYFYHEDRQEFVLSTWSKGVMQQCSIADPQTCYELSKTGIWGEAVRQRRPILLNDFQAAHPLKKGYPAGHAPLHRFLTIPVCSGDRIVAVAAVANKKDVYDDTDIRQLQLLMDAVWRVVEHRNAVEALRESEARVQQRLQTILSPTEDLGSVELSDIIDVGAIQHLMDGFYELTRVPNAIIDLKGKVLVGTGWQDICTKFHRLHPETLRNCIECDTVLSKDVPPGTFKTYLCKNSLWDCVTPLMIGGQHVGNLFTGQFFFEGEKPDDSVFRAQAARYGFDEEAYMAALARVPVWDRKTINVAFEFYVTLASMITSLSYSSIALAKMLEARKRTAAEHDKLQAQLTQAQKMESIGRLAGGVAHDFNNLLMGIMNYVELCRDEVPVDHAVRPYLDEIMQDAQRSADITRQLLAFARKQTIAPTVLDLNDALSGMLKMLRRLLGEDIDLAWQPGAPVWPVKMDPSQLNQILANLTVNARDAIDGVGKLTIETGTASIDQAYCAEHVDAVPGEYTVLTVSDSGCGMDAGTVAHLFEPFFTTKGVGEGTGLGLATVYGIVRQNNGFISVYSEPAYGTTFRIYLPRCADESTPTPVIEPQSERPGGTETILLVEDEKSIRVTARAFLEALGYNVLVAAEPQEALHLAAALPGAIDLLITDVVMPGLSGRDLARQLMVQRPTLKCLYMSGYTANVIAHRGILDQDVHFLAKPFTRDLLARTVREVLGTGL